MIFSNKRFVHYKLRNLPPVLRKPISYPSPVVLRKKPLSKSFSTSLLVYSDNPENNPNEEVPPLVKSRAKTNFDTSTIPDTNSDITTQARNLAQTQVNKMLHDHSGDYVEYNDTKTRDLDDIEIEKLWAEFESDPPTENDVDKAQKLYDTIYENITSAYTKVNEQAKIDKADLAGRASINPFLNEEEKARAVNEAEEYYVNTIKENAAYYDTNKGALIAASENWCDDIERRGIDYSFKESQGLLDESGSSPDKGIKRKFDETEPDSPGEPSSSRLKQDSSEVMQTEYNSWEPFGED